LVFFRICIINEEVQINDEYGFMKEEKTIFIKTFGCQQNVADSERLATYYESRGYVPVTQEFEANLVVINSCMIREKAEERVYGYIRNLRKSRGVDELRIVLTGCIVGAAAREPSGKLANKLIQRIPDVELLPIEDVGFEYEPQREQSTGGDQKKHAWVVISNGCNNYCAFCIVPFSRGKEISRPIGDILAEIDKLAADGYTSITLLGQNVNSYGSDLVREQKLKNKDDGEDNEYLLPSGASVKPVMVKHLNRHRIPTLFPYLLNEVAQVDGIDTITFTSSNPWDFSDALIDVIAQNKNIDRMLHLPVQSGSDKILAAMNRWYTAAEYIALIDRIKERISHVQFITDIIVGFPGETEKDFQDTIALVEKVGFVRSFTACYSERPGTSATGKMEDEISWEEKKRRFHILNELINLRNAGVANDKDWIATRDKHSVR